MRGGRGDGVREGGGGGVGSGQCLCFKATPTDGEVVLKRC